MTGLDEQDDNALAAEYVLHLLDIQERAHFEARLLDDADLRGLVHQWEAHLAPISDEIADVPVPPHVKAAILATVAPATRPRQSVIRHWFIGLLGVAAAVAIAFVALGPVLRGPVDLSPQFQAELASADGALVLTAGVIPATHEIVIERLVGAATEGRDMELWLIAEGSPTPVSLGLLNRDGVTRIRVPDAIAPGVRTGTIAISDEPLGGSPTGQPTGDVLATGVFVDI